MRHPFFVCVHVLAPVGTERELMEREMKVLQRFLGGKFPRDRVTSDLARLEKTMPGETGALAALRLGFLLN